MKKALFIGVLAISLLLNAATAYVIFAKNPMALQGEKSWLDMYTSDIDATEKFLSQNLGITVVQTSNEGGFDYRVIKSKDGIFPYAGIMQITDEMKTEGIKPHSAAYFTVEDYDAMSKQFKEQGVPVLLDGMVTAGMKFGFFTIPGGVEIGIVQYGVK